MTSAKDPDSQAEAQGTEKNSESVLISDTIEISPESMPHLSTMSETDKRIPGSASSEHNARNTATHRSIEPEESPKLFCDESGDSFSCINTIAEQPGERTALFGSGSWDKPETDELKGERTAQFSAKIWEESEFDGTSPEKDSSGWSLNEGRDSDNDSNADITATIAEMTSYDDSLNSSQRNKPRSDAESSKKKPSSVKDSGTSKTVPDPSKSESEKEDAEDDSVVEHIEGTNEIFIQSHAFDLLRELRESEEASAKTDSGKNDGARPVSNEDRDSSNVFGIVSSGLLPILSDIPALDSPDYANSIDMGVSTLVELETASDEVFVSKLQEDKDSRSSHKRNLDAILSKLPVPIKDESHGLPSMEIHGQLHPDDVTKTQALADLCRPFAIDHLYHPDYSKLLGIDVEEYGLHDDLDALFSSFGKSFLSETPCVACLQSDSPLDYARVIRGFLYLCGDKLQNVSLYTSAIPDDHPPFDLVTSMMSSRIGCFPNAEEAERQIRIERAGEEFFEEDNLARGLNILFVRYGLLQLVPNKKELTTLQSRSNSDILDVFLNTIQRDAKQGPVIIVILEAYTKQCHPWKDIVQQIQSLASSNIFVLVINPENDEIPENADVIRIHEIEESEIDALNEHVLDMKSFAIHGDDLKYIQRHSGKTFSQIWRMFQRLARIKASNHNIWDTEQLHELIPEDIIARDNVCFESLPEDVQTFLGAASCLGDRFYLNDLIQVLSFEPLPEEISLIKNQRIDWCRDILKKLIKTGDVLHMSDDSDLGECCQIPDAAFYKTQIIARKPDWIRRMVGAYALILEKRHAPDDIIASAASFAQLWPKAIHYWVKLAHAQSKLFYNRAADTLLRKCLFYAGPQYDSVYPSLLKECIELARRQGKYDDICMYAGILAQFSGVLGKRSLSCEALLAHGSALCALDEHNRAREELKWALKQAEDLRDESLMCSAYYAIAKEELACGGKGALVNGLRYAEKSLEICRRLGDLSKLSKTLVLCAELYLLRGEPLRAKEVATEAYHAQSVSELWHDTPNSLRVLAECAAELGDPLPLDDIERGIAIVEKTGDVVLLFRLLYTRIRLTVDSLQQQSVQNDFDAMTRIIQKRPIKSWIIRYHLLKAMYEYNRKNLQKATKSMKKFFDTTSQDGNKYLLSVGYRLSAEMNFEAHKRNLGEVSLEKTEKLFNNATAIFEAVGAWHKAAETLRSYSNFLEYLHRSEDAKAALKRAGKVDPYCQ